MTAPTRKHVFIIDDDQSVQKSLKRLLHAYDYDVSAYGSAEAFLKSESAGSGGCALLDVHMVGMNGLELQKKLNAMGSNLSVIFITADKSKTTEEYAIRTGAKGYLQKPFTQKNLIDSINRAFAEKKVFL